MRLSVVLFVAAALASFGCRKPAPTAANGPNAIVTLKDGSTFAGAVTHSDTSSLSLRSADGASKTFTTSQIAQVQYENQPAPPPPGAPAAVPPQPDQTAASPAPPPPAPAAAVQPAPAPEFRTIPARTTLSIRTDRTIDSETAAPGQTYPAVVARAVFDTARRVAIPRGAAATLVVREASGQGKVKGRSELVVDVGSVTVAGRTYRLETTNFAERGNEGLGANKRTGEFIGGGTALGGIIGAIAGGGKGAAIGALSGAAAGGATQTATRGKPVRIPAETVLNFRLVAPVRIREMR